MRACYGSREIQIAECGRRAIGPRIARASLLLACSMIHRCVRIFSKKLSNGSAQTMHVAFGGKLIGLSAQMREQLLLQLRIAQHSRDLLQGIIIVAVEQCWVAENLSRSTLSRRERDTPGLDHLGNRDAKALPLCAVNAVAGRG